MDSKNLIIVALVTIVVVAGAAAFVLMDDDNEPESEKNQDVVYDEVRLTVFGNANGDDTIDEKDIRIIDKVINNQMKLADCPYADANKDGNVDEKDKEIVNKLMKGEKTIAYINDHSGTTVELEYPLDNVITINEDTTTWHITFGARDAVIGHTASTRTYPNTLKAFDGTDTQQIPGGMRGLNASSWAKIVEMDKDLNSKGEKIGAVITDRTSNLGEFLDDFQNNKIPVIVIRVTDPILTINGVTLMSFLYGPDIQKSGAKFVEKSDEAMAYLNGKLATLSEDKKVKFLAFCMTSALAQKQSQYTLIGVAAGGIPVVEKDGTTSDKFNDVEAIKKYDGIVQQILDMKTMDICVKPMEDIWGDEKIKYLEKSAAFETTTFINLSMPGVCKVLYTAHVLYPELITKEYADGVLQEFFDEFMPFYHEMQDDKYLDVTKDMTTIMSYSDWAEYQKNKA